MSYCLAFGFNWVFDAAQAGAGDATSPMVINMIALWLVQIPLALLLARALNLGSNGIRAAMVLGWFVQAAMMTWRYRQGHWKLKQI